MTLDLLSSAYFYLAAALVAAIALFKGPAIEFHFERVRPNAKFGLWQIFVGLYYPNAVSHEGTGAKRGRKSKLEVSLYLEIKKM